VDNISLGGLTLDEAERTLRARLPPFTGAPIAVRYEARSWLLTPAELGLTVDTHATAVTAYAIGRQSIGSASLSSPSLIWASLQADLAVQWHTWRYGYAITPTLRYEENRLAYALKRIGREVDLPPREGTLTISSLDVITAPGVAGRVVNLEATRARLLPLVRVGQGGTMELVVEERQPVVVSVDAAAEKARALLARPVVLSAQGAEARQRFDVDRPTLRSWLSFTPALGAGGIAELSVKVEHGQLAGYLKEIAPRIDRPARNAELDFAPAARQVKVLSPSQVGQELEQETAMAAVETALLAFTPAEVGGTLEISLPVKLIQPQVDSNKVAEMGIVELVSEGTTYFVGSSRERVQNIVAAASKFRNVVVPPDAEFSFNKTLGDVSATNGFVDSLIIWGDRTAVGIGGGVCQVSTTAFRAAFFGGFPITERWAHGYVVSWYGEPGLDATIYTPDVDFRFRNDTGHFLLIKASVDTARGRIVFSFYGTRPNRTVEAAKPAITNVRQPEKPLYQEDPGLPTGTIRQVDWPANGMDVTIKRSISNADGTVQEEEFVSKYQPWRAVYLYGPGTALPADAMIAPTPTPAPTPTLTPQPHP
jgi:vancomycin resistance protein YoaR